jgi:hypothetical protein
MPPAWSGRGPKSCSHAGVVVIGEQLAADAPPTPAVSPDAAARYTTIMPIMHSLVFNDIGQSKAAAII